VAGIGLKRLESQIRFLISDALQNRLSDPRLEQIASVMRVEVSPDLSFADIYISVMGSSGQQKAYLRALQGAHGKLQSLVAKPLRTRVCPTLRFFLDQSIKKSLETGQLIDRAVAALDDDAEELRPEGDRADEGEDQIE